MDIFNPLSDEYIGRKKMQLRETSPTGMFIDKAVSTITDDGKLEVVAIYQMQLPAELREQHHLEVQKISNARTELSKEEPYRQK